MQCITAFIAATNVQWCEPSRFQSFGIHLVPKYRLSCQACDFLLFSIEYTSKRICKLLHSVLIHFYTVVTIYLEWRLYKSSGLQCIQVLALFSCLPSWECEDKARKRETMTSKRAEVLVCVEKSKGKLVNASDSWLTKGKETTRAVQDFTSLDFRNCDPLLCTSSFTT